ncbi:DUF2680 domain-containing protein [Anaeroselena agilis]|uniref:DUF2680 domain-containing protein n=1 Tax=Anaeroselena agilis TaxID=3063788 RepID=A0ABU3NTK8_9FIRM|nr:DUF2680 domain-containing protein [Selenomonadales bacterium 4137-cl]
MKKVSMFAIVALLILSFTASAFAAPAPAPAQNNWYCPYYGQYYNNLTDQQKEQIATWHKQSIEQRKQMLQQQVQWGWITQAQADQQITWMEQGVANGTLACGMMGGHNMGGMMMGPGMMGMGMGMRCW